MVGSFDEFVGKLQKNIYEDAKEILLDAGYQRRLNPMYMGAIENPDGYACVHGKCGDTMEIYLKFGNERVTRASYRTDGCMSSNVCGSFASELAFGKTPDELLEVTGESILDKLNNISAEDQHCAFLAAETLQEALNDYMVKCTKKRSV